MSVSKPTVVSAPPPPPKPLKEIASRALHSLRVYIYSNRTLVNKSIIAISCLASFGLAINPVVLLTFILVPVVLLAFIICTYISRTFLKVFCLSALAVTSLASIPKLASIPLIPLYPFPHRGAPYLPLSSFIPLSPSIYRFSPSLYLYLAKHNAERQALVNHYKAEQAEEKLWPATSLCVV